MRDNYSRSEQTQNKFTNRLVFSLLYAGLKPQGRRMLLPFAALTLFFATPTVADSIPCFPPKAEITIEDLIRSIRDNPACALPWRGLKSATATPEGTERLKAAYRAVLIAQPDRASSVQEMLLFVDAATGQPQAMLDFYDKRVARNPTQAWSLRLNRHSAPERDGGEV